MADQHGPPSCNGLTPGLTLDHLARGAQTTACGTARRTWTRCTTAAQCRSSRTTRCPTSVRRPPHSDPC
eukprot:5986248-Prymnesium_polylepis.1